MDICKYCGDLIIFERNDDFDDACASCAMNVFGASVHTLDTLTECDACGVQLTDIDALGDDNFARMDEGTFCRGCRG